MIFGHGNVVGRPAAPQPSYRRFIALLDVLGMKAWLEQTGPQKIAELLDEAFVACDQSSMGTLPDGTHYGPLIGTTHFSDTIFVWSPDDSWASFATFCNSIKMIIVVALQKGVPLRGSISVGDTVCNCQTHRFVGQPFADAFNWSENHKLGRKYRSVGVDITPNTLQFIRKKLINEPIPECWNTWLTGTPEAVILGNERHSGMLTWHQNYLFINHWHHGTFLKIDPTESFNLRNLPMRDDVLNKIREMQQFFSETKSNENLFHSNPSSFSRMYEEITFISQKAVEYTALDKIRMARHPF